MSTIKNKLLDDDFEENEEIIDEDYMLKDDDFETKDDDFDNEISGYDGKIDIDGLQGVDTKFKLSENNHIHNLEALNEGMKELYAASGRSGNNVDYIRFEHYMVSGPGKKFPIMGQFERNKITELNDMFKLISMEYVRHISIGNILEYRILTFDDDLGHYRLNILETLEQHNINNSTIEGLLEIEGELGNNPDVIETIYEKYNEAHMYIKERLPILLK